MTSTKLLKQCVSHAGPATMGQNSRSSGSKNYKYLLFIFIALISNHFTFMNFREAIKHALFAFKFK